MATTVTCTYCHIAIAPASLEDGHAHQAVPSRTAAHEHALGPTWPSFAVGRASHFDQRRRRRAHRRWGPPGTPHSQNSWLPWIFSIRCVLRLRPSALMVGTRAGDTKKRTTRRAPEDSTSVPCLNTPIVSLPPGAPDPDAPPTVALVVSGDWATPPSIGQIEAALTANGRTQHRIWRIDVQPAGAIVHVHPNDVAGCVGIVGTGDLKVRVRPRARAVIGTRACAYATRAPRACGPPGQPSSRRASPLAPPATCLPGPAVFLGAHLQEQAWRRPLASCACAPPTGPRTRARMSTVRGSRPSSPACLHPRPTPPLPRHSRFRSLR
jgi:hypothetical protein